MIDVFKISKALSDPIRYKIMLMLRKQYNNGACCSSDVEGVCNCKVMEEFGMIQSRVSYHMKELKDAGLVNEEAQGKWKYYSRNDETLREYIRQLNVDFKL